MSEKTRLWSKTCKTIHSVTLSTPVHTKLKTELSGNASAQTTSDCLHTCQKLWVSYLGWPCWIEHPLSCWMHDALQQWYVYQETQVDLWPAHMINKCMASTHLKPSLHISVQRHHLHATQSSVDTLIKCWHFSSALTHSQPNWKCLHYFKCILSCSTKAWSVYTLQSFLTFLHTRCTGYVNKFTESFYKMHSAKAITKVFILECNVNTEPTAHWRVHHYSAQGSVQTVQSQQNCLQAIEWQTLQEQELVIRLTSHSFLLGPTTRTQLQSETWAGLATCEYAHIIFNHYSYWLGHSATWNIMMTEWNTATHKSTWYWELLSYSSRNLVHGPGQTTPPSVANAFLHSSNTCRHTTTLIQYSTILANRDTQWHWTETPQHVSHACKPCSAQYILQYCHCLVYLVVNQNKEHQNIQGSSTSAHQKTSHL